MAEERILAKGVRSYLYSDVCMSKRAIIRNALFCRVCGTQSAQLQQTRVHDRLGVLQGTLDTRTSRTEQPCCSSTAPKRIVHNGRASLTPLFPTPTVMPSTLDVEPLLQHGSPSTEGLGEIRNDEKPKLQRAPEPIVSLDLWQNVLRLS
ncbi:cutinase G-box binding protein [Pseudozyma hubeiensis SY62]|uniref:Cutinase G-box binding protein n=1 Tax=Pseudozyma hubeiensis (strain SY62) TaxID=1305764 RepID=R9P197_PSEHS|nr:cutinase G-box binding protein [Pseudozyma hubeiensis SY62]GAC94929.1 cutinase G-box binding protein [Pseudozyma hubeiensis SY62]